MQSPIKTKSKKQKSVQIVVNTVDAPVNTSLVTNHNESNIGLCEMEDVKQEDSREKEEKKTQNLSITLNRLMKMKNTK